MHIVEKALAIVVAACIAVVLRSLWTLHVSPESFTGRRVLWKKGYVFSEIIGLFAIGYFATNEMLAAFPARS
jgi:hypothetical protein